MAKSDVWFETPPMRDDYQLAAVDGAYLDAAVKPKQFLHIDQAECILCEGCVDICPWKCIHYLSSTPSPRASTSTTRGRSENQGSSWSTRTSAPGVPLCIDRCPTGVISLGKFAGSLRRGRGARLGTVGVRHGQRTSRTATATDALVAAI